jgi:hypothetical protein
VLTIETTTPLYLGVHRSKNYYTLRGGVYVEGFGPRGTNIVRRLEVYQLPSWNRGTGLKRWHHPDLGMDARSIALDPDFNLLSLIKTQNLVLNGTTSQITFYMHLHTLDSNDVHPGAMFSKLSWRPDQMHSRDAREWDTRSVIVGNLLAVLFSDKTFGINYLVVWNWISGLKLLVSRQTESMVYID